MYESERRQIAIVIIGHLRQDGEVVGGLGERLGLHRLQLARVLRAPPPLHVVVHALLQSNPA